MKILYAASDRLGAEIQTARFLQAMSGTNHTIKVAAYHQSKPNQSIDWNLNAIKDIFNPQQLQLDNEKLRTYYEQIGYFAPDLIISDLEIYTSYVANILNIQLWQVSSGLLHHATKHKEKIAVGLFKFYPHMFPNELMQRIKNIIFNSDRNFIYSYFGDTESFDIQDSFEWLRPYYLEGKVSPPCQHNVVSATLRNDKNLIRYLKQYKDTVLFSRFIDEEYGDVILKDLYAVDEYACNLKNCKAFISQGYNDFVADAFYNGKPSIILPDFSSQESITNAMYVKTFELGRVIYSNELITSGIPVMQPHLNSSIKHLHQKIEEYELS